MTGSKGVKKPHFYTHKEAHLRDTLSRLVSTANGFESANGMLKNQEEVLQQLCTQQGSVAELLTNLNISDTTEAKQAADSCDDSSSRLSHSSNAAAGVQETPDAAASREPLFPALATTAANMPEQANNYAFGLLAAAKHSHQQRALAMTPQGWCTYYSVLVGKLCLLQSVINREQCLAQQQQQQLEHCLLPSADHGASQATAAQFAAAAAHTIGDLHSTERSILQQAQQQLRSLVDDCYTLILLTHMCRVEVTLRRAGLIDLSTGAQVQEVPASHWQEVAQAVQLTPQQVSQLKVAFQQFQRYKRALQGQQQTAVSSMVAVTQQVEQMLLNTAGRSSHSSSPQTIAPITAIAPVAPTKTAAAGSDCSSPAANGGSVDEDGTGSTEQLLLSQLQGVLDSTSTAMVMFIMFGLNTLTHWQRTQLLMKSYPFCPRAAAFVEAALLNAQQQQQQQQQQQLAPPPVRPAQSPLSIAERQHQRQLRRRRALLDKQRREFWAGRSSVLAAHGLPVPVDQETGQLSHEQQPQQSQKQQNVPIVPPPPHPQQQRRQQQQRLQQQSQDQKVHVQQMPVAQPAQQGLNQQQQQQQEEEEEEQQQQELLGVSVQDKMRQIAAALYQWKQAGGH